VVCVTLDARTLVVLETLHGKQQAPIDLEASASPAAPAVGDGVAYIPCRGPHLLAVALEGVSRWHFYSAVDAGAWLDKTPLVLGDHLYAALSSGVVLAVQRGNGSLAWRADVGPAGKSLSPPATDGERLYVGARDGLYALDSADGHVLWHHRTERRIVAAPVVAEGVVYAACHDHYLYALDASKGWELWRVAWERRIEVAPVIYADRVLAADRDGHVAAVERVLSAETYAEHGRWAEAATTYLRYDDLCAAARIFDRQLDQPLRAAGLWEQAGDPVQAAACYARAGRYDRAEALYRQLGQELEVAEMARLQGDDERAAAIYVQAGAWPEALACYLSLSKKLATRQPAVPQRIRRRRGRVTEERILRAKLHDLLVERFSLDDLRQLCFDIEIKYDLLEEGGLAIKALALIEYLQDRSRLADLVLAGQELRPDVTWEDALQAIDEPRTLIPDPTVGGPHAKKIAELSARLGQWERAGQEWAAVGEFELAAEAFVCAARQAERDAPSDEARLADLWAAAEACCEESFDEDQASQCHRQVACYRHLPYIEVQVEPSEAMVRGQYALVQLVLHNAGGGPARQVVVHHTLSDFAGDLGRTQRILGLAPGRTLRQRVSIRPTASGPVPLRIVVDYADAEGRPYQVTCRSLVDVREPGKGG
jgi:hypothetical protein